MKILTFPADQAGQPPISHPVYFPNIGQYLDIEALKLSLSGNNYTQMLSAQTAAAIWALDLIDAIAHLQVLCPTLARDLNFSSYLSIPLAKASQISSVYKEQFYPWYWPQLRTQLEEAKLLTATPASAGATTASKPAANATPADMNLDDLDQFDDSETNPTPTPTAPGSIDLNQVAE